MDVIDTPLCDVKLVRPTKHKDERGWFTELFNAREFAKVGLPDRFVQDNESFTRRGILRGLHYQIEKPQGKLVRCLSGHIWDVVVDLRRESKDLGRWAGFDLKGDELEYLWIPEGFGHGFLVLSEDAYVTYKTTRFYDPACERSIRWNDPTLAIRWPLHDIAVPIVSSKDAAGKMFVDAELIDPAL